jgi:hypothetical protein
MSVINVKNVKERAVRCTQPFSEAPEILTCRTHLRCYWPWSPYIASISQYLLSRLIAEVALKRVEKANSPQIYSTKLHTIISSEDLEQFVRNRTHSPCSMPTQTVVMLSSRSVSPVSKQKPNITVSASANIFRRRGSSLTVPITCPESDAQPQARKPTLPWEHGHIIRGFCSWFWREWNEGGLTCCSNNSNYVIRHPIYSETASRDATLEDTLTLYEDCDNPRCHKKGTN